MPLTRTTEEALKQFILKEFLPGEDPDELDETTPLVSTGILDSLATLKLVTFLEDEFGISVAPHEADEEHLNTIASICARLVGDGCLVTLLDTEGQRLVGVANAHRNIDLEGVYRDYVAGLGGVPLDGASMSASVAVEPRR